LYDNPCKVAKSVKLKKLGKINLKISLFPVAPLMDLILALLSGVRRSAHNCCESATRKTRSLNLDIP